MNALFTRFRTVILFLFSGGTVAIFQLVLYTVLSRVFELWFLLASTISFVCAVAVSFLLQKFVTFENKDKTAIPRQLLLFILLAIFNLNANAWLMLLFVEKIHIYDILAQALTMITIAIWSFFFYRHVVFKKMPI